MKRLKYVGTMASAVLETGQTVTRGETIEVPDEVAERYSKQPENFKIEPVAVTAKGKGGR